MTPVKNASQTQSTNSADIALIDKEVSWAAIAEAAKDWGYFSGALYNLPELWVGKRVLDVGMGGGPHCASFIEGGAQAYVGVDPLVGTTHVRDFRAQKDPTLPTYHQFPYGPAEMMAAGKDVTLYSGILEQFTETLKAHNLDVAVLSAVSEHLQDPHAVFRGIWEVLAPGGVLWLSHCNYYSWTGHHRYPRSPSQWDKSNPDHNRMVDWAHLEPQHPDYSNPNFNRVRLSDFRDLIEKYFEIQQWKRSPVAIDRLTPEIRSKFSCYTIEELLTQNLYVTAKRRDEPLGTDLSDRVFFHPTVDGSIEDPVEDIEFYKRLGSVYLSSGGFIQSHSDNDFAAQKLFEKLSPGCRIKISKLNTSIECVVSQTIVIDGVVKKLKVEHPFPAKYTEARFNQLWSIEAC